ncbi:MAG: hypothetical protein ABI658_31345 [Acidimicrobiales bacterium]
MRPWSRRRPAGVPQVPIPPLANIAPREPVVVRLAVDRTVIDEAWGMVNPTFANVWPDATQPDRWARVQWPIDTNTRRAIAPVDLQLGHVLEVASWPCGWRCYAWVADIDARRFVLAPVPDACAAVVVARQALEAWRATELAIVEAAWRSRVDRPF